MASTANTAPPRAPQPPSSSRPPRNPTPNPPPDPPNANPNPNPVPDPPSTAAAASNTFAPPPEAVALSRATHLTRPEVLRLRSHRLKQLARCYRDHYWALMEELKVQYREYYWVHGVSPFRDASEPEAREPHPPDLEHPGEDPHNNNNAAAAAGTGGKGVCAFVGCKTKAMALTSFCNLHILSDSKQKLYKPCSFVIKSAQAGPITCSKPILRSTVPSLCSLHSQKAQRDVSRALRKGGLSVASSNKLASKFHVIVAEYVRQIQAKRRATRDASQIKVVVKEETAS
ncbi:hypothetical protein CDL15_Pgr019867 [Punica granatum]|uniref:KAT8 regulatory NSL complex subunit 2 n=1 Tax=Punica granatum TaxID=22663 RepID=A0A218W3I7_PUNGR|nr:hypothetical protein CDL15_Pgr019867 [Punica granatum]